MKQQSLDEIVQLVKSIRFLDWEFRPTKHTDGYVFVAASVPALDSLTGECVKVKTQFNLVPGTRDRLIRQIWHEIQSLLIHESSELFEVDGIKPFHQHRRNYEEAKGFIKSMLSTPRAQRKVKCPKCGHTATVKHA